MTRKDRALIVKKILGKKAKLNITMNIIYRNKVIVKQCLDGGGTRTEVRHLRT